MQERLNQHDVTNRVNVENPARVRVAVMSLYAARYQGIALHPLERAFAKLKALLRSAAARTVSELWAAIQRAFVAFQPAECRNDLTAAGYDAYDPT